VYVLYQPEAIVRTGSFLDGEFVDEVKRLTGADVCLASAGIPLASTYPSQTGEMEAWRPMARIASSIARGSVTLSEPFSRKHEGREYLTIHVGVGGVAPDDGFDAFVGRELETEMTPILVLEKRLVAGGVAAVIVTLLVGFFTASSISKPLSRIVQASVALTKGQYDYPIDQRGSDEVALLGRNFAHMRESLATHVQHLKSVDQAKSNPLRSPGASCARHSPLLPASTIVSGALGTVPENVRNHHAHHRAAHGLNRLVQSMLTSRITNRGCRSSTSSGGRARCGRRRHGRKDYRETPPVHDRELGTEPLGHGGYSSERCGARHPRQRYRFTPMAAPSVCARAPWKTRSTSRWKTSERYSAERMKWIFEKIYVWATMHHCRERISTD
jgi:HAMP domain-containing protein